jgi:hypothetical protein
VLHTHITVRVTPAASIKFGPFGNAINISTATPIFPAFKNYSTWGFLEVSAGILNHFFIYKAVASFLYDSRRTAVLGLIFRFRIDEVT